MEEYHDFHGYTERNEFSLPKQDNTAELAKGEAFFELKEYDRSFECFAEAINLDPTDYRGWWGACRCRMLNNYLCIDNGYGHDFKKAQMLAPEDKKEWLEASYDKLLAEFNERKEKMDKSHEDAVKKAGCSEHNIAANMKPKNYTKEFIYIGLLTALCPLAIWLGFYFRTYLILGIMIGAMAALTVYALLKHILECKKALKLLEGGCDKVSELMKGMKKTKKPEFLRLLGGMIKEGHLAGYEITEGEYIHRHKLPSENKDA